VYTLTVCAEIHTFVKNGGNEKMVGVSAALLQLPDSTLVSMTMSDADGGITFSDDPSTDKLLHLTFTGYEPVTLSTMHLPDTIRMHTANTELDEVEVIGRSIVTYNQDGVVTYIPKGIDLQVGNVYDVLRFAPLITFKNDEIYMFGEGGTPVANIMINGKRSSWDRSTTVKYLKTLPPSHIVRIEIVRDLELLYGVKGSTVNIVVKNPVDGLLGSVDTSVSWCKKFSETAGVLLAYHKGKFSATGTFKISNQEMKSEYSVTDIFKTSDTSIVSDQNNLSRSTSLSGSINFGYNPNGNSAISVSFSISDLDKKINNAETEKLYSEANLDSIANSRFLYRKKYGHPDWTLAADYWINLGKKKKNTFNIYAYYGHHGLRDPLQKLKYEIHSPANEQLQNVEYEDIAQSKGYTTGVQAQYVQDFASKIYLGLGFKMSYANYNIHNNRNYICGGENTDKFLNVFTYQEWINLPYTFLYFKIGSSFSGRVGISVPFTDVDGNQSSMANGKFKQQYANYMPDAFITYNTPDYNHLFRLSYNADVQRPSYSMLNPYINWTSATSGSCGNPEVTGHLMHTISFIYSFLQDYSIFVMGNIEPDAIETVMMQTGDNNTVNIYDNVGRFDRILFSAQMSKSLFNGWWRLNVTGTATYTRTKGAKSYDCFSYHGWDWELGISNTVFISPRHKFYAAVDATYYSGNRTFGSSGAWHIYSLISLNKSFSFGGELKLYINPHIAAKVSRTIENPTFIHYSDERDWRTPYISLRYSQTFGNTKVKSLKDKTLGVSNRF